MASFKEFLQQQLRNENLPGWEVQKKLSPYFASGLIPRRASEAKKTRTSSVLVLIYQQTAPPQHKLLFTLRSDDIAHHSGQISFPGGKVEPGENVTQAALREAREEVCLHAGAVDVVGQLSGLYIYKSNNYVHPSVAFCTSEPDLEANPREVQEFFFTPFSSLHHDKIQVKKRRIDGTLMNVPYWNIHSTPLWGATAMMVSELMSIYDTYRSTYPEKK